MYHRKLLIKAIIIGVAAGSAITGSAITGSAIMTANAQDSIQNSVGAKSAWTYQDLKENPSQRIIGKVLHTKTENGQAVAFWCDRDSKFKSAISFDGDDLIEAISTPQKKRLQKITYKIGNKSADRDTWLHVIGHDVVIPNDSKTHRQLYNAAVRGSATQLKTRRFGDATISFPAIDRSKFSAFRQGCEL